jgi:hypothetical protein
MLPDLQSLSTYNNDTFSKHHEWMMHFACIQVTVVSGPVSCTRKSIAEAEEEEAVVDVLFVSLATPN